MRTINGFLRSTLVIFILIQQLVGQDEGKTEWTPGAVPMGSQIGLLAAFPVVKNAPYTADITRQQTTVLDGTKRLAEAHNIQRRDSNGRLLDEQVASPRIPLKDSEPFTQRTFVMDDPVEMLSVQWGESTPTALVSSIKVPPGFSNGDSGGACPAASGWANLEQRELGERKMHGVVVQGCRTIGTTGGARSITVVIETWQSPTLRIQLLSTERDSDGNESRMEVTRLRLGEPDLSKFAPPEHYKVVTAR